jgi:hypothetical protein
MSADDGIAGRPDQAIVRRGGSPLEPLELRAQPRYLALRLLVALGRLLGAPGRLLGALDRLVGAPLLAAIAARSSTIVRQRSAAQLHRAPRSSSPFSTI